jgi:membrane protein YdbS with pleckstrin-like domain
MSYDQMMAKLANFMKTGSKTNAFAPLIWLCSVVMFMSMTGIYYFKDPIIKYVFVALIVFVVVFSAITYVVILIKDPRLLQTENYRIEDKKLDIIASKGMEIKFNPVDLIVPKKNNGGTKNITTS